MKFSYDEVVKFHGHSCPGLAIGYRVSLAALERLGFERRAEDEELVCVSENDSCAVDAIQLITGCTLGKGNLILKDYGKQVYTFFSRKDGRVLRISVDFEVTESEEDRRIWERFLAGERTAEVVEHIRRKKGEKTKQILEAREEDFLRFSYPSVALPKAARIFRSLRCAKCGEKVSEVKARLLRGEVLCIPCLEESL